MRMSIFFSAFILSVFFSCKEDNSRYILLKDAEIISFRDSIPFKGSILVKDSIIWKIARDNEDLAVPSKTTIIDCSGKYVIPGLWDSHTHFYKITRQSISAFNRFGITSARDMGGDADTLKAIINDINSGRIKGPRIKFAGPAFENPWFMDWFQKNRRPAGEDIWRSRVNLANKEDAQRLVDSVLALGVDFIKVRYYKDKDTYFALARAARNRGVQFAGHAPYDIDPLEAADAGQTSFEHGWYPSLNGMTASKKDSVIKKFISRKCVLVPTLTAWKYNGFIAYSTIDSLVNGPNNVSDPRIKTISPALLDEWKAQLEERKANNNLAAWSRTVMGNMLAETLELYKAGIPVMAGSDVPSAMVFPAEGLHDELALFVTDLKLTPYQALQSAITVPAKYMNVFQKLGTIEKGKLADVLVLDKNPLSDIRNSKSILTVIKNGEVIFQ